MHAVWPDERGTPGARSTLVTGEGAVADHRITCNLTHRRQRTNTHTAARDLDASQGESCNIDKKVGLENVVFHQVKQGGAAGNIYGFGVSSHLRNGCFRIFCTRIAKWLHGSFLLA